MLGLALPLSRNVGVGAVRGECRGMQANAGECQGNVCEWVQSAIESMLNVRLSITSFKEFCLKTYNYI